MTSTGCAAPRVLVVEDEAVILFALEQYLGARGYTVDTAVSVDEGRRSLGKTDYDVLITDLRLARSGGLDGLEILRFANSLDPRPRSLILTAYTSRVDSAAALELGAARVFTKPVDLADLEKAVAQLLKEGR